MAVRRQLVGTTALTVLAMLGVAAVHGAFALDSVSPVQTKDEIGYLMAARLLAGGSGAELLAPDYAGGYSVGWSLLVAPLWWASPDPVWFYRAAVTVNVLLAALTVLPYAAVARRTGAGPAVALLVAVVVSVAPGRVLYTGYALPEALLALLVAVMVALALRLSGRAPAPLVAPALAGLSVMLALTHTRYLPMAVLTVGLLAVTAWQRRSRTTLALVPLTLLGLWAGWWVNAQVEETLYPAADRGAVALTQVRAFDPVDLLMLGSGHLWYGAVAWLGLAVLGVVAGVRAVLLVELPGRVPGAWTWLVLVLAAQGLVGAAYLSSRLGEGGRVDQLVYGRYADPVWAVAAAVGAAALVAVPARARLVAAAAGVTLTVSAAAAVSIALLRGEVAGFVQLNVPGLEMWAWTDPDGFVVPWPQATAACLGFLVLALVLVRSRRGAPVAVLVAGVLLLGGTAVAERRNIEPRDAWIRAMFELREPTLAEAQRTPDAIVALVADPPLLLTGTAFQYWLGDLDPVLIDPVLIDPVLIDPVLIDPSSGPQRLAAGTLVLGPLDSTPTTVLGDLELVEQDPVGQYALWRVR